ncbi:MAG: tRNA dihydrouridine synthase DusB [Candidatus Kapaibacteriales bacterium]
MKHFQMNNSFKPRKTHIGNVPISNGVFLAPMEDVSDLPFRVVCRELGADIFYSEFISSEGIIRDSKKAARKMLVDERESPTAIQIFGADFKSMADAAKVVEDAGADILDINFGCWVKKVVRREAGAAFLKDPDRMAEMTREVIEAVDIPVTVKTRLGWSQNTIVIEEVAKKIEQTGAKALAIHCRTRDMGMTGRAQWEWIPVIRDLVDIPIILNGDVKTPADVREAFETTGCDAMMIGRGCIGYPFIFKMAKEYIETGIYPEEPSLREKIDTCLLHLNMTLDFKGPHGLVEFRKHYSGYLKGYHGASAARKSLMDAKSYDEAYSLLNRYYDQLESENRLDPIEKGPKSKSLSCESDKYVKKQLIEN